MDLDRDAKRAQSRRDLIGGGGHIGWVLAAQGGEPLNKRPWGVEGDVGECGRYIWREGHESVEARGTGVPDRRENRDGRERGVK